LIFSGIVQINNKSSLWYKRYCYDNFDVL